MMTKTISLQIEVPEVLYDLIQVFLEKRPQWDQDRMFCAALSLFLIQNGDYSRHASRIYLDTMFSQPSEAASEAA